MFDSAYTRHRRWRSYINVNRTDCDCIKPRQPSSILVRHMFLHSNMQCKLCSPDPLAAMWAWSALSHFPRLDYYIHSTAFYFSFWTYSRSFCPWGNGSMERTSPLTSALRAPLWLYRPVVFSTPFLQGALDLISTHVSKSDFFPSLWQFYFSVLFHWKLLIWILYKKHLRNTSF